MRPSELTQSQPLTEAPLGSLNLHGDFSQDGSFAEPDRKLVRHHRYPERVARAFIKGSDEGTCLCRARHNTVS
jgi:hypothetical protein